MSLAYSGILFFCLLISSAFSHAESLVSESFTVHGLTIPVFTYRPEKCQIDGLVFVFHGQKRNAEQYREFSRSFAQQNCMLVIAPKFTRKYFPNWRYQRGGIIRRGKVYPVQEWTVSLLAELVQWARQRESDQNLPYFLFGHSAGAQFLSRVAAFAQQRG